jgi:hypothetical protein
MPSRDRAVPPRVYSPVAGLLSYLVPGLGQIVLGNWSNVYIPDTASANNPSRLLPRPVANLYNRLHYVGQFWIGVAAWPAIWQYNHFDPRQDSGPLFGKFQRTPPEEEINTMQRDSDKRWDLGWIYTVIAGVLNILVIYDAFAGPAFAEGEAAVRAPQETAA